MDTTTPDANKFEIQIITKNDEGQIIQRRVEGQELNKILEEAKVFEDLKKWISSCYKLAEEFIVVFICIL